MSLRVVSEASRATGDRQKAQIVVESTIEQKDGTFNAAWDELNSPEARAVAQQFGATLGMGTPHINGNVIGPYPVNSDGVPLDDVKREDEHGQPLPPHSPQFQPHRYRVTVPLCVPLR